MQTLRQMRSTLPWIFTSHSLHKTALLLSAYLILLSSSLVARTDVTSREQFNRVLPGGLPHQLEYNTDRASLEVRADDKNCPKSAQGFFELSINSHGNVTHAKDVGRSRSLRADSMAVKWVRNILMQIRFRPLRVGTKITSVHTFTTVVCR